jgi:hypothetical protein
MSGTLVVQNLQGPASGANANKIIVPAGQVLDASAGFVAPAGSVIQVVQDQFSDAYSTTSTGGTQFRAVSITPKSASSKILILTSFMCRATAAGGGNCFIRIQAFRNGSIFWDGYPVVGVTGTDVRGVASINYLDSPATTSPVSYTFNYDSAYASVVYINATTNPSTITLMEIAQ